MGRPYCWCWTNTVGLNLTNNFMVISSVGLSHTFCASTFDDVIRRLISHIRSVALMNETFIKYAQVLRIII